MNKLSEKSYWDSIYKGIDVENKNSQRFFGRIKTFIKYQTRDYTNNFIWEYLLPKYLPKDSSKKIIEIGCAPGKYLLDFKDRLGYEPYGVEYSEKGVEITKSNFVKKGISEHNVIQADFFDSVFHDQNDAKYDVVFSRGFIEHFDKPEYVVKLHKDLVKSGGYIVVMIPNLSGVNNFLARILNIDSYNLHNTSIMNESAFKSLFTQNDLEQNFCGPVGFFSWGLFNTNSKIKYIFYRAMLVLQRPFDFLWRSLLGPHHFASFWTSPYLLFIGRKK